MGVDAGTRPPRWEGDLVREADRTVAPEKQSGENTQR
jgi:hypothetical protein